MNRKKSMGRRALVALSMAAGVLYAGESVTAQDHAADAVVFDAAAMDRSPKETGDGPDSLAWFEGEQIDLSVSWGEAHACSIADTGNHCFRTEAELHEHLAEGIVPFASCSSSLYLWDLTNKSGDVLALSTAGVTINLSNFSFASRTSSYQIGACNSVFRDASNVYPGNTSAGASANSMASGWNNRVTRVYIS